MNLRLHRTSPALRHTRSALLISFGIAGTLACSSRVPGPGEPTPEGDASASVEVDASAVTSDGTETTDGVDTTSDTETSDTSDTPADTDTGSDETDTTDTDLTDTSSDQTDTSATGSDETDTTSTTDGSDATETDDTATTDDTTDGTDTTDPSDGAIDPPEGMVVVSNFDATDTGGFRDGSSSFPSFTVNRANSIGTLVLPFTAGNQQGAWSFNSVGDYCGYELVARIRLVSGFNTTAAAVGRVQLRAWNSNWSNFVGTYDAVTGVGAMSQLGEWVEYRMDLDDLPAGSNADFDPHDVGSVGIAFISGTDASAAFEEATFEMDWIGFLPKPGGCPDDGDDTDTTDATDMTEGDGGVDTTDDTTVEPMPDVIVVSEFDAVEGFPGYTNITDHTPALTVADSIGTIEVPVTGGNYQQSSWNFGFDAPERGLCGYDLVARVRIDEGFNASAAAAGGLQLRAWSDDVWSGNIAGWSTLDATAATGEWVEHRLSLDVVQDGATFNPATLHAVGIAFISGGAAEAEYTPATFSVDWIRFEAQVPGQGGCAIEEPELDGGVDSGPIDEGDGGVPGDDSDAGMGDEDASVIDEDGGIDEGDAGVGETDADVTEDAAVEDNGAIEPPSNALVLLSSFDVDGDDLSGTLLAPGYYEEQGGLAADTTWVVEDSVARFTVPHTGSGQAYTLFFGVGNVNGVGHELIVRLRVVSDLTGLAPPHIQMSTSSSDGDTVNYSYNDFTVAVDANSDYWNWKEYTLDIDTDANYPEIIQGIGVALNSWYSGSSFGTVEYEIDWVAIVPKP